MDERFIAVTVKRTTVTFTRNAFLSLLLLLPEFSAAEDFKLIDGTIFRDARVLEARPDAVVLLHDRGIAMVDLAKLPRSVRARFRYDPKKAAAYRIRELEMRKAEAEENRRLVTVYEKEQQARILAQLESAEAGGESSPTRDDETQLSFRMNNVDRNFAEAVTHIATDIAQKEEARIIEARTSQTFWGAPFWKNPIVAFVCGVLTSGGARGDGSNSEPRNWR